MELETGLEVTERSASKSESQRLAALNEIVDIYGFDPYPGGAKALIDRIIRSEKCLCSATNLPAGVESITGRLREDLESVLKEDMLVYEVITLPQPNVEKSRHFIHPIISDEDGLQALIIGLDPEVRTYILASSGGAYWRLRAKEPPEDYKDKLKCASDSHDIVTEEHIFSFYGFGYIPESPGDIAAAFQRNGNMLMSNVFRGLLNLFRRIRGNQAYNPRRIWREVEDFEGDRYLLLRRSHNRVCSKQFPDRERLMQYLELYNPGANEDTFWIISPKAVYRKSHSTTGLDILPDL